MNTHKQWKDVNIDTGWYSGEPWKLFELQLVMVNESFITLFAIQVFRLCFSIYFDTE